MGMSLVAGKRVVHGYRRREQDHGSGDRVKSTLRKANIIKVNDIRNELGATSGIAQVDHASV